MMMSLSKLEASLIASLLASKLIIFLLAIITNCWNSSSNLSIDEASRLFLIDVSCIAFLKLESITVKSCFDSFCFALFLRSIASVICLPILTIGLRLDNGSWKIMAILSPRMWYISFSVHLIKSLPS